MPLIRKDAQPAKPAATVAAAAADTRWAEARESRDVPQLAAALVTEADPRVREAILTSLVHVGNGAAVHAVLPQLRSDDASLRTAALDALCAMAPAVAEHLPSLLQDADPDVRLLICEVARHLPEPEATKLLCGVLDREDQANVCASAVEVLAEVGGAEALPALAACAARFADDPFLGFAIRAAVDRIGAQTRG
jgi:HEAT repeat protein